jgi:protein-disulfide isomerase-like protein with CxxC motif
VALPVYIGRVYVKQAALTAARDLLAEKGKAAGLDRKTWNMESPQWQGAERDLMQGTDALIQRKGAKSFGNILFGSLNFDCQSLAL